MSERRYYYISLPYYSHRVFKCAGFGAEKPDHLEFYLPHFEKFGHPCLGPGSELKGAYKVLILDSAPVDLVDETGNGLTLNEALSRYGARARIREAAEKRAEHWRQSGKSRKELLKGFGETLGVEDE